MLLALQSIQYLLTISAIYFRLTNQLKIAGKHKDKILICSKAEYGS